jgi:DUF2934 family protein
MNVIEKRIRERAYELWDHAGRPDDRSDEFWFAARAEFEPKEGAAKGRSAPVPRRAEAPRHETAADWGKRESRSRY